MILKLLFLHIQKHPDSINFEQEYDVLKKKIDLGATKAITQFFLMLMHILILLTVL